MVKSLFSVYDVKAEFFAPPFLAQNKEVAVRSFIQLAQDENSTVSKYPADYILFFIGDFDDSKGLLKASPCLDLGSAMIHLQANVSERGSE